MGAVAVRSRRDIVMILIMGTFHRLGGFVACIMDQIIVCGNPLDFKCSVNRILTDTGGWQCHRNGRSRTVLVFKLDPTVVLTDEAGSDCKPQSNATFL